MQMLLTIILCLLTYSRPNQSATYSPCSLLKIENHLVNWGHQVRGRPREIEAIIIHSSYYALGGDSFSVDGVLREYRKIDVSPHYIIDRAGTIYRLVPDGDIAYHAGKSHLPDGNTHVNSLSIGIEIINTQKDSPTDAEYNSVAALIKCLKSKYPIKYLLGHSDIASGRKTDPWNFDWKKFNATLMQR